MTFFLLCTTLILAPFDVVQFFGEQELNIRLWNFILLAGTYLLLLNSFLSKRKFVKTDFHHVWLFLLMAMLISLFNSDNIQYSIRQLAKLLFVNVVIYWFIINTVTTLKRLNVSYVFMLIAGDVAALYGLLQYLFLTVSGINIIQGGGDRPNAWFSEATWLGNYLASCFSVGLPLMHSHKLSRRFLVTSLLLYVAVILISATRSAQIALGAVVITYLILRYCYVGRVLRAREKMRMRPGTLVALIVFSAGLLGVYVWSGAREAIEVLLTANYLRYLSEESVVTRYAEILHVKERIVEHPIIGNGLGTVRSTDPEVLVAKGGSAFNIFLGFLHDVGIVGLTAFVGFLAIFYWKNVSILKWSRDREVSVLAMVAILSLTGIMVMSQFNPFWQHGIAMMLVSLNISGMVVIGRYRHRIFAGND